MTLEEQLITLMHKHDVETLSLSLTLNRDGSVWFVSSNAHARNAHGRSICAGSNPMMDGALFKDAVAKAIGTINEMRAVGIVSVGDLEPMGDEEGEPA